MEDLRPGTQSALHEHILEALGEEIVSGALVPGARVLSGDLAARFGASRSAVREVVRVLESMGLVEVRRKAGVEILPAARWDCYSPRLIRWRLAGPQRIQFLGSLGQLRAAVEPLAARLAADQASGPQRATIVREVMGMVETAHDADSETYLAHDIAFHRAILAASGNPLLDGLAGVVEEVLRGRTRHALMPHEANPYALRLHQEIAARIADRDAPGAEQAMREVVGEADAAIRALGDVADGG